MMRIQADHLQTFAEDLLRAGGYPPQHARQSAEVLVWANLRGADSHGVLRIPRYLAMIDEGKIIPDATPAVVSRSGGTAVLDAGRAPGGPAMTAAMDLASDLATESGIGCCVARNISHAGAIGYYTLQAAERGMVGIAMTASGPLMAYHGATGNVLSTNPLSIAVPAQDAPVVLDMSTSAVALGKVLHAREAGTEIPKGWAMDATGAGTTDPHAAETLLPMAGAKGSGLSLMIEVLCSLLAGNPVITKALRKEKVGMNGMALVLDIRRFCDPALFAQNVTALSESIHALPPAPGVQAVLMPGERGFNCAAERQSNGIPLAPGTHKKLTALAQKLGITTPDALAEPV